MTRETSMPDEPVAEGKIAYVGTLVGESTSREFRMAVAHEAVREQDLIAVDVEFRYSRDDEAPRQLRVWAKVQRIERINPLFPIEAGHELAETRTNPLDTVLSLSREMVTAVCQVLGAEPIDGDAKGKLDHLRYPASPASCVYRPGSSDVARVVLGDLQKKQERALDIATLSNRPEVTVLVDGHTIVTRHLAILAMTGAGKSWTSRRIIEQLAEKRYPIVIFDPHGDYTGLSEVPNLGERVRRYYAQFPVFEEDAETVAKVVDALGYELSPTMRARFDDLFHAASRYFVENEQEMEGRTRQLAAWLGKPDLIRYPPVRDLWLVANLAEAAELLIRGAAGGGGRDAEDVLTPANAGETEGISLLAEWGWEGVDKYSKRDAGTLEGIKKRVRSAAKALKRMEETNRKRLMMDSGVVVRSGLRVVTIGPIRRAPRRLDPLALRHRRR